MAVAGAGLIALGVLMARPFAVPAPAAFPHAASKPVQAPAPAVPAPAPTAPQAFQPLTPQQAAAFNASIPISTLPNPPAAPFSLGDVSATDRRRALDCLAMAVYYEAASQGDAGEAAVAQVVLNRVRNPLFPKTICAVVFQGADLPTGCQFTFTCDGSLARPPSPGGWKDAVAIARRALDGHVAREVGEATHYHTIWVVPYWQPSVVKLTRLGANIFYRWRGGVGRPGAFTARYAGGEMLPALPGVIGADLAALKARDHAGAAAVVATPIARASLAVAAGPPAPIQLAQATAPPRLALPPAQPQPTSYFGHRQPDGRPPLSW